MNNFKFANCRGDKPVIRDIIKCLNILATNSFEIQHCPARKLIDDFRSEMVKLISEDYPKIKIYK